jgi:hypothetical protein
MTMDDHTSEIVELRHIAYFLTWAAEEIDSGAFLYGAAEFLVGCADEVLDVATRLRYGKSSDAIRLTCLDPDADGENTDEAADDGAKGKRSYSYQQDYRKDEASSPACICKEILKAYMSSFDSWEDGREQITTLFNQFGAKRFTDLDPRSYPAIIERAREDARHRGRLHENGRDFVLPRKTSPALDPTRTLAEVIQFINRPRAPGR